MTAFEPKPLPVDLSFDGLFAPDEQYDYFRHAADHPFRYNSDQYQSVNSWWLAEASLLVYVRNHDFVSGKLATANFPDTRFFEHSGTQAFVTHNHQCAIVCFRGTEVNEFQDILTDLNLPLISSSRDGRVHKGFKKALDKVWECDDGGNMLAYLHSIRAANPTLKIWFTGHSLGAALATLAAGRFENSHGLYTFGSPRVGDSDYRNSYAVNCYRFVNNNDLVTMIPPSIGYQHIGQLKYIDDQGHIHDNPGLWSQMKSRITGHLGHIGDLLNSWQHGNLAAIPTDFLNDHAPIYYAIRIWNNHIRNLNDS